jgi:hypothetical protein
MVIQDLEWISSNLETVIQDLERFSWGWNGFIGFGMIFMDWKVFHRIGVIFIGFRTGLSDKESFIGSGSFWINKRAAAYIY